MKPRSINIFLLDGDPNGIRVAQISMSTIQAIAFRRNQLRRVREAFPEIERPGVYILIGADEDAQDRQLAYITTRMRRVAMPKASGPTRSC